MSLHPTAIIDPSARLGTDVQVGPYAVIGPDVEVGDRCIIGPHSCLHGPLVLGADCRLSQSVSLGDLPQVKGRFDGFGRTVIGQRNVFREFVQVHRSMKEDGATVLGDDGMFMAGAHIGHDTVIGNHVILVNYVLLAGHVSIGDGAFLSGASVVHQYCRVGTMVMAAGQACMVEDAPPYAMIVGARPALVRGLNVVGLRRAGMPAEHRKSLNRAFKILFRSELPLKERLAAVEQDCEPTRHLVEFVAATRKSVIGFGGRSGRS